MIKVRITLYTNSDSSTIASLLRATLDEACIEYGNLDVVANQHPLALSTEGALPSIGIKGIAKTDANSCQLRYLGDTWVISVGEIDTPLHGIDAVIRHINLHRLYIINETIMTPDYAQQLWYKLKN